MSAVRRGACLAFPAVAALAYAAAFASPGHRAQLYLAVHLVLVALMLVAWRLPGPAHDRDVLWAGIAARLVLYAVPPFTTHDVARYLWDGKVALEGWDPYVLSADSAATAALRPTWAVAPEHAAYPTLYPPVAIALFALCAAAGPVLALWAWKALATLASVGTVLLARAMLRDRGLERHLPLVAMSPLLVLETGVGAHLDALTALAVAAALLAAGRNRPGWCGVALGLGGLIKFLPLTLLLPLALERRRGFGARMGAAALATVGSGYAAAFALGLRPFGSLGVFFEKWRFGATGYALWEKLSGAPPSLYAGAALMASLVIAAALLAPRRPGFSLAALLFASPVVFPWYLSAVVPALALAPSLALVGWTVAAPLSYEVIDAFDAAGRWAPQTWPAAVCGAVMLLGALADVVSARYRTAAFAESVEPR